MILRIAKIMGLNLEWLVFADGFVGGKGVTKVEKVLKNTPQ